MWDPRGDFVKVNQFVYHSSSPGNRKYIKKEGLIPLVGDCYLEHAGSDCEPAVFATNSDNENYWFDSGYDEDVWEIDTKLIPHVKWYADRHFDGDYEHIVTFHEIPPGALKLIYEGSGQPKYGMPDRDR